MINVPTSFVFKYDIIFQVAEQAMERTRVCGMCQSEMYIAMNEYDIQQTFSAAITDTQTFSAAITDRQTFSAAITDRQTFYSMYTITYIVTQNDLHFNAYDSDGTSILTTKKTNKEEG